METKLAIALQSFKEQKEWIPCGICGQWHPVDYDLDCRNDDYWLPVPPIEILADAGIWFFNLDDRYGQEKWTASQQGDVLVICHKETGKVLERIYPQIMDWSWTFYSKGVVMGSTKAIEEWRSCDKSP